MSTEEKTRLVPKLRFPEFRDSGEWETKLLSDLVKSFKTGKLDANAMVENGQYRFYTCAKNHYQIDHYAFEGEALLVAGNGAHLGYIHHYVGKFNAYQRTYVLQQFEANVIFIRCLLDRFLSTRIHLEKKDGNTPYIVLSTLTDMPLAIPVGMNEQQKIADCLSSLDELIAVQARKVDALKTHKKGLMQQLFPREGETQPRWRFPEFRASNAWSVGKLGDIAENLDNKRVPITSGDREAGSIPYYGASGIVDFVKDFIFDEDLLCVSEDGANLVARTYPIAFPISGKTWVNNHAHVLKFKHACTQKFVEIYLNSIKLDDFITGMAQPKLNKAMLDSIPVPHPGIPEQQRIADCITALDELIKSELRGLDDLKTHKQGLMQQLFPSSEALES